MFGRKREGRTALIPNQWSGSVQQYYHFLLGYLAPIMLWQQRHHVTHVTVRDCGPMNRWFQVLEGDLDVEVMNVGHFLHVYAGKLQPCVVLRGMDFPQEFDPRKIQLFRALMLRSAGLENLVDRPGDRTIVIDRMVTDPFYATSESEIDMAGAQRRSVPNLAQWAETSRERFALNIYDTTDLEVRDQVQLAAETRVLIGQHGAGLTNMVFMKPGGVVIEIHPPLPAEAVDTFALLARACGHTYVRVPQTGVHANVDPDVLTAEAVKHHA